MTPELVYKAIPNAVVKAVDPDAGTVEGYFAAFGNVDRVGDVIVRGAFADSIDAWKAGKWDIYHLRDHEARTDAVVGKIIELEEDDRGLRFVSEIIDERVMRLYRAGIAKRHSVGFVIEADGAQQNDTGGMTIRRARLYEGSTVLFPANPAAETVAVKAIRDKGFADALMAGDLDAIDKALASNDPLLRLAALGAISILLKS